MKTIAVDFDNTIAPWGPLFDLDPPFDGVIYAMQDAREAGYRIVIHTSRLSPTWWGKDCFKFDYQDPQVFGEANVSYVIDYLQYWNIPFDGITAEKVPADAFFDDRAVAVKPGDLASALTDWLANAGRLVPHG
jgi:hypothetical protein